MSDIALNDSGDIDLVNNAMYLNSGGEAIRQHLQTHLGTFQGEWFLDTSVGIPWYQDILVKNPHFSLVQQIIKDAIFDTPGVIELRSLSIDFNKELREATVDFQCLSTEDFIDFSKVVGVNP